MATKNKEEIDQAENQVENQVSGKSRSDLLTELTITIEKTIMAYSQEMVKIKDSNGNPGHAIKHAEVKVMFTGLL